MLKVFSFKTLLIMAINLKRLFNARMLFLLFKLILCVVLFFALHLERDGSEGKFPSLEMCLVI